MDIKAVNPSAHSDQEEFPIGGGKFLHLPTVAKGQSVTAAARKLTRGVDFGDGVVLSVPEPEAMAIATAVVDPTQLRLDIERKRVSLHLTPSGETLVSVQGRVWAAGASADGANGRGRLEAKLAGRAVWPLPVDGDGKPSMRYVTRDIDRMREAVRDNAARIANADLNMRVREHPPRRLEPRLPRPRPRSRTARGRRGHRDGISVRPHRRGLYPSRHLPGRNWPRPRPAAELLR